MPESRNRRWSHRAHGSRCAAMARTAFAMLVVLLCAPAGAHAGVSVPAHLFAGVWGTLAASIVAGGSIGVQLLGVVAIGAFTFGFSWLLWKGLEKTVGVRVSPSVEQLGQDAAELGIEAYPEFVLMPEQDDDP